MVSVSNGFFKEVAGLKTVYAKFIHLKDMKTTYKCANLQDTVAKLHTKADIYNNFSKDKE